MRGADPIREARTRAGLTQDELEKVSGISRSPPSIENFLEVIEACGFTIPLVLVELDSSLDDRLKKNRYLSTERRARRLLTELGKSGEDG
jgi:transcriptional regulator with XRE-family HTH domain